MLYVGEKLKRFLAIIVATVLLSTNSWGAQESPQSFVFQGRMAAGGSALIGNISLTLGILDPTQKCFLYEEYFPSVDVGDQGLFSVVVGTGTVTTNSPAAAAFGGSFSLAKVFANNGSTLGTGPSPLKSVAGETCPSGNYTSVAGDLRYLRVVANSTVLTPNIVLGSVPQAIVAETLQGFGPNDFVKITNANYTKLTNNSDVSLSNLHNHDTLYVAKAGASNVNLGSANIYLGGKFASGSAVAPTGTSPQFNIISSAATNQGLVVKGATGQTANLFEAKNFDGTVVSSIDASGKISGDGSNLTNTSMTDSTKVAKAGDTMTGSLNISISANNTSAVQTTTSVALGKAFSGTADAGYGVYGTSANASGVAISGSTGTGTAGYFAATGNTTNPVVVIRGGSGSGDLTAWKNNSGTTLASISSAGVITGNAANTSGLTNLSSWTTGTRPSSPSVGTTGFNTTTGYLETYTGSTWVDSSASASGGNIATTASNTFNVGNQAINISNAADNGLNIKGAAAQSGNLQEWKNSTGTVLASVNSAGKFVGDGSQLTGLPVPTTALAFASNPSDCSAGQFATTIAANGNLTCAQIAYSQLSGTANVAVLNAANTFSVGNQAITVSSLTANGFNVDGAVGQTGHLIDFKNSTGTVLSYFTGTSFVGPVSATVSQMTRLAADPTDCAAGQFATTIADTGNLTCSAPQFANISGSANAYQFPSNVAKTDLANTFSVGAHNINIATNTDSGLTLKAASSQTSNFLEFKNNGGTVLSGVGASGEFNLPVWTNATRPAGPSAGTTGYNSDTGYTETYTGATWVDYSAGAGGVGSGDLLSNGTVAMAADFDLNSHKIINLGDPTNAQDAATKNYMDTTFAKLGAANTFTVGGQVINIGTNTHVGLTVKGAAAQSANLAEFKNSTGTVLYSVEPTGPTPSANANFTNKSYVDSTITALTANTYLEKNGTVTMTGALDLGTHKINNVTDPGAAQDAATKNYVDTNFALLASGNTFSVGGQVINNSNAATVGATIKGATGQTANLAEFKNSTGTVLSKVNSSGNIDMTVSGNVAAASSLTNNPTDCGAGQFATTIAANGNLTCAAMAFTNIAGSGNTIETYWPDWPSAGAGGGNNNGWYITGDSVTQSSSTIYMPGTTGFYKSTNNGQSITKTSSTAMTCVWVDGSTVYVCGNGDGIYISTDSGATFPTNKTTANGLGSNTTYGIWASGTTVYVATSAGLSVSTNGGSSFTNKTTANGLGSNTVNGVYSVAGTTRVFAATEGGLSVSTDSGSTFTNKTTGNGLGNNAVKAVYATGVATSTVYAATSGGLSISTDNGSNFTNKTTANGLGTNSLTTVSAYGSNIATGGSGGGGLSISTDGGSTFTTFNGATNGLPFDTIGGVFVNTSSKVFVLYYCGLLSSCPVTVVSLSSPAGSSQLPSNLAKTDAANSFTTGGQVINTVMVDSGSTGLSDWASGLNVKGAAAQSGNLTNWQNSTGTALSYINSAGKWVANGSLLTGISASSALSLASNPTDCGANQYATAISTTGNLTCSQIALTDLSPGSVVSSFTQTSVQVPTAIYFDSCPISDGAGTLYAHDTNGGDFAFNLVSGSYYYFTSGTHKILAASGNDLLWSQDNSGNPVGIYVSHDKGITSTLKTTADGLGSNTVNHAAINGSTIYVATSGGLSISTDSGSTFTNKTSADGLHTNNVNLVVVVGSRVYALNGLRLSISTDGGSTFTTNVNLATLMPSTNIGTLAASLNNVYFVGGSGIYVSNNGGTTFSQKTTSNGLSDNGGSCISASGSNVYVSHTTFASSTTVSAANYSSDAGATWTSYTEGNGTGLTNDYVALTAVGPKVYYVRWTNGSTKYVYEATGSGGTIAIGSLPATAAKTDAANTFSVGGQTVTNSAPGEIPLTIKGAASQTGALTQWKNYGGTVLASVNASGQFTGDGSLLTGLAATSVANQFSRAITINIANTAHVGLTIKGANPQTNYLQKWKDWWVTDHGWVDKDGGIVATGLSTYTSGNAAVGSASSGYGVYGSSNSGMSALFKPWDGVNNTASTLLIQQNTSGQAATVKMLEAKNSTGTSIFSVDAQGWLTSKSLKIGSNYAVLTTTSGLGSNQVFGVAVSGSNIYAATAGGLSISNDGGLTWINKTSSDGLALTNTRSVFVDGSNVYVGTSGGGLSISTNGGTSWTTKTTANGIGSNIIERIWASGNNIYLATDGGLSFSTNGGTSFAKKTTANGLGNNVVYGVYVVGSNVYAATSGGLSISTNSGSSFTNKTTTDGLASNTTHSVFVDGGIIYVTHDSNTCVYLTCGVGLSKSTNGGTSFSVVTSGINKYAYDVWASGTTVFIGHQVPTGDSEGYSYTGGISLSSNTGATFSSYKAYSAECPDKVFQLTYANGTLYAATLSGLAIYNSSLNVQLSAKSGTSPTITLPNTQGNASTFLHNTDGNGTLAFDTPNNTYALTPITWGDISVSANGTTYPNSAFSSSQGVTAPLILPFNGKIRFVTCALSTTRLAGNMKCTIAIDGNAGPDCQLDSSPFNLVSSYTPPTPPSVNAGSLLTLSCQGTSFSPTGADITVTAWISKD